MTAGKVIRLEFLFLWVFAAICGYGGWNGSEYLTVLPVTLFFLPIHATFSDGDPSNRYGRGFYYRPIIGSHSLKGLLELFIVDFILLSVAYCVGVIISFFFS